MAPGRLLILVDIELSDSLAGLKRFVIESPRIKMFCLLPMADVGDDAELEEGEEEPCRGCVD